jgi:hypothetical protein
MTFTIAALGGEAAFADAHLFVDIHNRRKRSMAHIDRSFTKLRLHRNAEALRLLEADWENTQFIQNRRTSHINALSSEVNLMERQYDKSGFDASFQAALTELRDEYSLREQRAEERLQSQLYEHTEILRDLCARADEREELAQSLAEQEREHLDRQSESMLASRGGGEKAEYERLQAELNQLHAMQSQYRKNKEKLEAFRAERDQETTVKKPVPKLPGRIQIEPPKKKTPKRLLLGRS